MYFKSMLPGKGLLPRKRGTMREAGGHGKVMQALLLVCSEKVCPDYTCWAHVIASSLQKLKTWLIQNGK